MPPSCCLPPVEFWRGTSPIHAARSRPDLKALGSVTVAAIAVATITPTPGIDSSRWLISLARCCDWMAIEPTDLLLQRRKLIEQGLQRPFHRWRKRTRV